MFKRYQEVKVKELYHDAQTVVGDIVVIERIVKDSYVLIAKLEGKIIAKMVVETHTDRLDFIKSLFYL